MSKSQKLLIRFLSIPADFTWDEYTALLRQFGFEDVSKGGGSARTFMGKDNCKFFFHRPHPGKIVKRYVLRETKSKLIELGLLKADNC